MWNIKNKQKQNEYTNQTDKKPGRYRDGAGEGQNALNRVQLLATPWTAAYQAPPPMGFSRQECWSRVSLR